MARNPGNRSELMATVNDHVKWDEVSDDFTTAMDKLSDHLNAIETLVNATLEELEKLPETFDVDTNYVELDGIIEKIRKISGMIY